MQVKMLRMRAGILAVGTELLGTDRLDSNSLLLTEVLQRFGVDLQHVCDLCAPHLMVN